MRTGTIFRRYEQFVAAAAIAAHATAPEEGFRQRDLRFLIELFSNWVEMSFEGEVLPINNTQVQRYLDELVDEGFAKRKTLSRRPHYRLTRPGLIDLLGRLIPSSLTIQAEHFFFLYYFLKNYGPLITRLVESEGKRFPLALKHELEMLLDTDTLLDQQIRFAELELQRLEERISDSLSGGRLAEKLLKDQEVEEVSKIIEQEYPYELNSQRPLSELISDIPAELAAWELSTGGIERAEVLWQPARELMKSYLAQLRVIQKRSEA